MGSMNKISLVSQRNRNKKKSAAEIIAMPPLLASMHPQSEQGGGRASLLLPPIELQPPRHPHDRSPEPYFEVCTCQLCRCFRIVDRSLQQPSYFLLTSLKSDCPRPPVPQGPVFSTAVRLVGPHRPSSQPYSLKPYCSSAKLTRRSEDPHPD